MAFLRRNSARILKMSPKCLIRWLTSILRRSTRNRRTMKRVERLIMSIWTRRKINLRGIYWRRAKMESMMD